MLPTDKVVDRGITASRNETNPMRSNDDICSGAFYGESIAWKHRAAGHLWWGVFLDIYSAWVKAPPNLDLLACIFKTSHTLFQLIVFLILLLE